MFPYSMRWQEMPKVKRQVLNVSRTDLFFSGNPLSGFRLRSDFLRTIYLDVERAAGKNISTCSLSFLLASLSLNTLFQTLRRHRYCLLRGSGSFFIPPSRVVVASGNVFQHDIVAKRGTSDLVGSGRRWMRLDWAAAWSEHLLRYWQETPRRTSTLSISCQNSWMRK